jgi:hypothetical protein
MINAFAYLNLIDRHLLAKLASLWNERLFESLLRQLITLSNLGQYGQQEHYDQRPGQAEQHRKEQHGCWAHARRNFFESHAANGSAVGAEALNHVGDLYQVERNARDFDPEARHVHRQMHAKPLVDGFLACLTELRPKNSEGSATAKAFDYILRRQASFVRYLDDDRYPIDNNPVKNAIWPVALGRKNWLFTCSLHAGQRAANIMSLLYTARANGQDPFAYLRDVLDRLPTTLDKDIRTLLPQAWKPASG